MNVTFWMNARDRLIYRGQTTLHGAIMDRPDNDPLVQELEEAAIKHRGAAQRQPIDAVEMIITERVDAGETLPLTNPEGFQAARWLAQGNLASLPDPIPRAFVLYIAAAWHEAGKYPTLKAALLDILSTRSFV